ncbi:Eco57I restriction-modification methylase domain-containing protein [Halorientalis pallida]|uniref:Eco57I restriction-modification methylase domain-containing protein n=1 Tax=Halorientalis pallida TaxID=2479928 RepID=UPI003C6EC034
MSTEGTQTEFDFSEFETAVSEADKDRVIETLADSIDRLRDQVDDDFLDGMFQHDPGRYTLKAKHSQDQLDPEPLTKNRVIEPLLDSLGYEDYGYEAGSFAEDRGEQADYAVSLRDVDTVDSTRLLIEAEPVNKPLQNRGHGLDQVESWLSQREFESDFGFATDGVRWIFVRYNPDSYTHNIIEQVDLRPVFLTLFENATAVNPDSPTSVVTEEQRELISTLLRTFNYGNFVSIVGDAPTVLSEKKEAITQEFYDDYIQIVFGVSEESEERRARSLIGEGGIESPEEANGDDVRLFAVELMNRLIFVKFLEDKRIVRPDLLDTLVETYEEGIYPQSFYKTFLDPLFYDVFNEKPERDPQIESIDVFADIPYLNGGLFRPELNGSSTINERDFDVSDSVLESIIDLLERYRFSTDGGPTDIDPSVLGSVFEKTINYLSTDPGDQNKELGAYYTPSEITRFCAEETVRPALLERFKTVLHEERGWPEAELQQYNTLYELIDGVPGSGDMITSLLSEVDEFYVIDPSMGSGHFLTSVVEEIVNIRQSLYARQEQEDYPSRHRLKKTTIQNNIYGVDIMEPAVEIGKLRLWLSIISELREEDREDLELEELALPNIGFNVQQGNSLIGYVDFPEETDDGDQTFENFNDNSVRDRYEEIIEHIELYEESAAFPEKAKKHRQKAKKLQQKHRKSLDKDFLHEFQVAVDGATEDDLSDQRPFHWMLEFPKVYADGGFDVIVGNPPWDMLQPRRDEFFTRYRSDFRSLKPDEKEEVQEELLENERTQTQWEEYKRNFEIRSTYFTESSDYSLQWGEIDGRTRTGRNELSMLFLERVFEISHDGAYVQQLLPGKIFRSGTCKNLRLHLLNETTIRSIAVFENKGIFDNIDNRQTFGVLNFKNSGESTEFPAIFMQRDTSVLSDFYNKAVRLKRKTLEEYSPEAITFPFVRSQTELNVLETILQHPNANDNDGWSADPYIEIYTRDSDYFTESKADADYPVYGGSNLYQFVYNSEYFDLEEPKYWSVEEDVNPNKSAKRRVREKNLTILKSALYDKFDGDETSKSKKAFVNDLLEDYRGEPLKLDDVKLDCTDYRIAFRCITKSTNERTFVASMIPPGIICYHALSTIRPFRFNPTEEDLSNNNLHSAYEKHLSDRESFVLLGLLNSIPFDFLMRTKIDVNISKYKFEYSPLPHLSSDTEWFEEIWTRSARLNCYGEEFEEMRKRLGGIEPATKDEERQEIQAELDAAAFHAYGLTREKTEFVLDDFYQVQNPRMMTDEYFDLVLEKYDELND